ncbi:MAG: phosphatase PAP2 family protein [Candidatus Pacearchaeota archaeon]|jgi:undecaprenyl-diphosphatase
MNETKKRDAVFIWILIAAAIFLSFYFDGKIVQFISTLRTPDLSTFFIAITSTLAIVIVFVLINAFFLQKEKRKWLIPLWLSAAVAYVIAFILKIIIQRQRPFELGIVSIANGVKETFASWDFSFPSSHAILVFAVLPFITKEYPKLKYVWIVFACLVAFSRVYLGVHFLSDVISGAVIGYLVGFFTLKWWEEKFKIV